MQGLRIATPENGLIQPAVACATSSGEHALRGLASPGNAEAPRPRGVGVWLRAQDATNDEVGADAQRAATRARQEGLEITRFYDASLTAPNRLEELLPRAILADIERGIISTLIISDLGQVASNTAELAILTEYIHAKGATLVSLAEALDTGAFAGAAFHQAVHAIARWERKQIERRKERMLTRAKAGRALGGATPFGYRREGSRLVLDEVEAPVRQRIFELFIQCPRLKAVARILNVEGHRTRGGKLFSDTTVRRLIMEPTAKGVLRLNHTTSAAGSKRRRSNAPEEWILVECPAVVSPETWQAANDLLGKPTRNQEGLRTEPVPATQPCV